MKTLYELLEALPDDDADGLRAAFRKAAKANHPDFNPGDAEASERFRRIVRANAILSDQQQRAEYDRLLELAKRQQSQQSRQPKRRSRSSTVRWLAADALMSAVVFVMLIGGYFVYKSVERSPIATAQAVEIARREPAQVAAVKPADITEASSRAVQHAGPPAPAVETNSPEQNPNPQAISKLAQPDVPALTIDGAASANTFTPPPGDHGARDIAYYRERGLLAYRSGELHLAIANFGVAIDLDPGSPDSYVDRGIVFHRLGDLKRALSDVAEAKRLDDLNRKQSAP
jgi:tetratricopeptide (TPR) repeat protein